MRKKFALPNLSPESFSLPEDPDWNERLSKYIQTANIIKGDHDRYRVALRMIAKGMVANPQAYAAEVVGGFKHHPEHPNPKHPNTSQ
jgi:hypothetical protein